MRVRPVLAGLLAFGCVALVATARIRPGQPGWLVAWTSYCEREEQIRNPADWMPRQFLEVWAVRHGQPYDVVELPPGAQPPDSALAKYSHVVSTVPRRGAWGIGNRTAGLAADPAEARRYQDRSAAKLAAGRWVK